MEGMIESCEEWMKPMLEFRNWRKEIRGDKRLRKRKRRDGTQAPGPFTLRAREMLFRRLMDVEMAVGMKLLPEDEKQEIQRLWELDEYQGPSIWEIEYDQKGTSQQKILYAHRSKRSLNHANWTSFAYPA